MILRKVVSEDAGKGMVMKNNSVGRKGQADQANIFVLGSSYLGYASLVLMHSVSHGRQALK